MEISAGDVFNGFVWLNLDFFWGHFEFMMIISISK